MVQRDTKILKLA